MQEYDDADDGMMIYGQGPLTSRPSYVPLESSARSRSKSLKRAKRDAKGFAPSPMYMRDDDDDMDAFEPVKDAKIRKSSNSDAKRVIPEKPSPKKKTKKAKKKVPKKVSQPSDDQFIQVIQIPKAEEAQAEPPESPGSVRDKPPTFPSRGDGDGMMPLETMAETTEIFTNAFRTDKYEGAVSRRKPAPEADLSHPVEGWLAFQVPIVPHPDDVEFERQATKQYDLSRLLHKAKSC